ncbi:hypothetical protein FQR65_LT14895 [Abscondita terminalis]|nr:hypothetical protein FQR65_LT14895 [Abscondita terminalis]
MIRSLSPQLQIQAIKELNEVPERITEDIKTIREWLIKQPHLKAYDDDQTLITFLRGCKYSLQTTKNKLDFFYTVRTLEPKLYNNRDPFSPDIQRVLNAGLIYILPETDDDGARIIIWNPSKCDPNTMPYETLIKIGSMFMNILMMEDDNAIISGIKILVDLKNVPLQYATQFTPLALKIHMQTVEKALPLRIKCFHFTNCPAVIEFAYNLIKSFISSKLVDRMSLHNDVEKFYTIVPQRLMPKEYGGTNDSLANLQGVWKRKMESYREWFLKDVEYKSNESLRPGEPKTWSNVFGVEGSFRKLVID